MFGRGSGRRLVAPNNSACKETASLLHNELHVTINYSLNYAYVARMSQISALSLDRALYR